MDALRSAAPDGVNVTIDLLWGDPGLAAMGAAARFARHVHVGSVAAGELGLPAPLIRSVSLDVRGFSVAHPPIEVRRDGYLRVTEHAAGGDITVDPETMALDEIPSDWDRQRRAGAFRSSSSSLMRRRGVESSCASRVALTMAAASPPSSTGTSFARCEGERSSAAIHHRKCSPTRR
jgi:hypothetical protein